MKGAKVKVADRLAEIVLSLYQGEILSADIIRQRFDVDRRTAYRDLNRLGAILEDIGEGKKRLASFLSGHLNVNELLRIAKHADIVNFYPHYKISNYHQFMSTSEIPELLLHNSEKESQKAFLSNTLLYSSFDAGEEEERISKQTVATLQVLAPVAIHFKHCNLLPFQRIIKEFDNGDLLLNTHIDSPEEIFPLVQYWIPHLKILSPQNWQTDLKERVAAWCDVKI